MASKEETSGQLRAVKIVSKLQFNLRELEALVELQDVGLFRIWGCDSCIPLDIHAHR